MKQNKRFILLVVMVLLANCLFAGLASAAVPTTGIKKISNLYIIPTNYDGITLTSADSIDVEVPETNVKADGSLTTAVSVKINFKQITSAGGATASTSDNICVAYTSTETANSVFVVKTADVAQAAVTGDVSTADGVAALGDATYPVTVTLKKSGTATITVAGVDNDAAIERGIANAAGAQSRTLKINVIKSGVKTIAIYAAKAEYTVGNSISVGIIPYKDSSYRVYDLSAYVTPEATTAYVENKDNKYVKWESSDTSIALWNKQANKFQFLKDGEVTITATSAFDGKVKDSVKLTVKKAGSKPIESATFTPDTLEFDKMAVDGVLDTAKYLGVKPSSDFVGEEKREWSIVEGDDLIEVDGTGKVTLTGNGKTGTAKVKVIVYDKLKNTKEATVAVKVDSNPSKLYKVTVDPKAGTCYYLNEKEKTTLSLTATATQTTAATKYTWSSDNPAVAIVETQSKTTATVTPTGEGTANITVTATDGTVTVSAKCVVTVNGASGTGFVVKDTDGKKSTTLRLKGDGTGTTKQLKVASGVTLKSEDEKIATVKDGVVTAAGIGETHIIATDENGNVALYGVSVKGQAAKKITASNITVKKGETVNIGASVDADAYNKGLTYTITSKSAAKKFSVDKDGNVKGLKVGKGKINIKSADGKVSKKITVKVVK